MDGQANARSRYDDSDKRTENVCKERLRNRNRGTNNQPRYKLPIRTGRIMIHPEVERQAETSKSYWKKSNGCIRNNNHHGHS